MVNFFTNVAFRIIYGSLRTVPSFTLSSKTFETNFQTNLCSRWSVQCENLGKVFEYFNNSDWILFKEYIPNCILARNINISIFYLKIIYVCHFAKLPTDGLGDIFKADEFIICGCCHVAWLGSWSIKGNISFSSLRWSTFSHSKRALQAYKIIQDAYS